MSETYETRLKEIPLPSNARQRIINLFKLEGFRDEQIDNMPFVQRTFINPLGLNELIFDMSGWIAPADDWDQDADLAKSFENTKRVKPSSEAQRTWARLLEEHAFRYLDRWLGEFGWTLKNGEETEEEQNKCIGWRQGAKDILRPDLAVEMFFPALEDFNQLELSYVVENTIKMRESLRNSNAKSKYILVGVSQDKSIKALELAHSDSKVVYQRCKFTKLGQ